MLAAFCSAELVLIFFKLSFRRSLNSVYDLYCSFSIYRIDRLEVSLSILPFDDVESVAFVGPDLSFLLDFTDAWKRLRYIELYGRSGSLLIDATRSLLCVICCTDRR